MLLPKCGHFSAAGRANAAQRKTLQFASSASLPSCSCRHHCLSPAPSIMQQQPPVSLCKSAAEQAAATTSSAAPGETPRGPAAIQPDQIKEWCVVNFYHLVEIPNPQEVSMNEIQMPDAKEFMKALEYLAFHGMCFGVSGVIQRHHHGEPGLLSQIECAVRSMHQYAAPHATN